MTLNRRILLMVHGLASSPEAWVNMANDLMGDYAHSPEFSNLAGVLPHQYAHCFESCGHTQVVDDTMRHFDPSGATCGFQRHGGGGAQHGRGHQPHDDFQ
jgi:hypothetical protein